MDAYYDALRQCGVRYRDMRPLPGDELFEFTELFIKGCDERLPLMKLCRWLGYIQGLLIERRYTTVKKERDWTRPLFRRLDFPSN